MSKTVVPKSLIGFRTSHLQLIIEIPYGDCKHRVGFLALTLPILTTCSTISKDNPFKPHLCGLWPPCWRLSWQSWDLPPSKEPHSLREKLSLSPKWCTAPRGHLPYAQHLPEVRRQHSPHTCDRSCHKQDEPSKFLPSTNETTLIKYQH